MKQNELTIEIPNNKVVDWDESKKQNKIVLKDKQLTYEDICEKLFKNKYFYTDSGGRIYNSNTFTSYYCANNAVSEHQLECILAKNMLANVAKYLNNGWKPINLDFGYYFIFRDGYDIFCTEKCDDYRYNSNVLFKTKELAQQAIEILGAETIKLALEPLGI